jgi:hypothetical protein
MVIYACGLLLNPPKAPIFQNRARLYSMDQKLLGDNEKTENLDFETWPKSQNSNIRHDGVLSIGKFMLMKNNLFSR